MKKLGEDIRSDFLRSVATCWIMIKRAGQRYLAERGYELTIEQVMVLSIVEEAEGLNLGAIADRIDRDRTTCTRMVDGLERRNLVVRVPDRSDSRQKLVYLTRLGRQRLAELDVFADEFVTGVFGDESDQDLRACVGVLERVTRKLGGE